MTTSELIKELEKYNGSTRLHQKGNKNMDEYTKFGVYFYDVYGSIDGSHKYFATIGKAKEYIFEYGSKHTNEIDGFSMACYGNGNVIEKIVGCEF